MQPPNLLDGIRAFMGQGSWIWLADAARLAGSKTHNFRERLQRLNVRAGGGIVIKHGPGKYARYKVDLEALRLYYQTADKFRRSEIDELFEKYEETNGRLEALRRAHIDLRATVDH